MVEQFIFTWHPRVQILPVLVQSEITSKCWRIDETTNAATPFSLEYGLINDVEKWIKNALCERGQMCPKDG